MRRAFLPIIRGVEEAALARVELYACSALLAGLGSVRGDGVISGAI